MDVDLGRTNTDAVSLLHCGIDYQDRYNFEAASRSDSVGNFWIGH